MKFLLHIFAAFGFSMLVACSGSEKPSSAKSADTPDQTEEILNVARRQASRFVEIAGDDMPAQGLLLDVRSKETQLRQAGRDKIADDYVNAFTAEVRRLNPTLADTTFTTK